MTAKREFWGIVDTQAQHFQFLRTCRAAAPWTRATVFLMASFPQADRYIVRLVIDEPLVQPEKDE